MFKSKHSGWTWDLKRTPFGGGGGFISSITDPISNVLGTSGGNGGLVGILQGAGNSVANAGAGDWATENGWMIPLAMATAGVASGALGAGAVAEGGLVATGGEVAADGTVFAAGETIPAGTAMADGSVATASTASYDTAVTTGQSAYDSAIANGATQADAQAAADAAYNASYGGSSSVGNLNPAVSGEIGANTSTGTFGSLNPALPSAGAPTGTSIGMSGQLAPGTIMGTGATGGGAIGSTYAAGANGLPATDFFGNYIPASSINTGGVPSTVTGTGITSDTLNTLNNVKKGTDVANQLSKLLSQGAGSGLSSSLGQLAKGANSQGQALTSLVRGNTNPFAYTAQQPIQNAKPLDLASLANLLKQG